MSNVTGILTKYLLGAFKARIATLPLGGWSAARWMDMAWSVAWLLDHDASLGADQIKELQELGVTLHTQGADWDEWFEECGSPTGCRNAGAMDGHGLGGHNVNNAQGLKSAAVWYRFSGNKTMAAFSKDRMKNLDAKYGLPTGMFNGDEILPSPATRSPSRGIELCGVVEAMWSYNTMFSVHGDVSFADRAERIAYNALPATWASPKGGDMWAHQYLQAINQVQVIKSDPHVWAHDGDEAELYGLEPNFGCCTANFNQGWPKFANNLVFRTQDGGAAIGAYAPVEVHANVHVFLLV